MDTGINKIVENLDSKLKVLIIGAAIVDMILPVDKLPKSGQDIYAKGEIKYSVGGCAFNVADVLEKLNLDFDLLIPLGTGVNSDKIRTVLQKNNYKTTVCSDTMDNGFCISLVERDGERTFITVPGIETEIPIDAFKGYDAKEYDYIYLSGYELESRYNARNILRFLENMKPEAKIVLDFGPRIKYIETSVISTLLSMNTVLTINDKEALELSNKATIEEGALYLNTLTNQPVIITLGAKGALIADNNKLQYIPGFTTEVVDTIGAGDAHTGGIIAGMMSEVSLEQAVLLANKIAAYVVSKQGAATAPKVKDLLGS